MRCEIGSPYCEGEAEVFETPLKCCENCFAWVGYAKVKPVSMWLKLWRALSLFVVIVWRTDMSESRMSAKTAWSVARGIHGS